jgi:hypothetical protein
MGFNDNRVTLREPWGEGAHNALNIVGDFLQQSFGAKALDAGARFATPVRAQPQPGGDLWGRVGEWWNNVTQGTPPPLPEPATAGMPPVITVPDVRQPEPMRLPELDAQQSGPAVSPGGSVVVSGPNGGVGNSVVMGASPIAPPAAAEPSQGIPIRRVVPMQAQPQQQQAQQQQPAQSQAQPRYSANAPVSVVPPRASADTAVSGAAPRTITIDVPPTGSAARTVQPQQQETTGTATGSPTAEPAEQ